MHITLLINRLDTKDFSDKKLNIFFLIGDMDNPEIEDKLFDVIHNSKIVDTDDIILKYNGVDLFITVQQIPLIVKLLADDGFSIYGVYHPYNPGE